MLCQIDFPFLDVCLRNVLEEFFFFDITKSVGFLGISRKKIFRNLQITILID